LGGTYGIRPYRRKLHFNVAVNDADYVTKTETSEEIDGRLVRKLVWICPYYQSWRAMLERCYSGKYSSYAGCTVCEEWLTFSNFKSWMEQQDWESKQLDKDLLIKGNKVYSPETCVFVSNAINKFILERASYRGDYPIGASWHKASGKFIAQVGNPISGKREYIGVFNTAEEAHAAWLERKLQYAVALADKENDPIVAEALVKKYMNYSNGGFK
jgi:hypothetical protein